MPMNGLRFCNMGGYSLPDKLFEFRVSDIISTCSVLALIHGAVHASFEECACGPVRLLCHEKLVEFVNIAIQITPHKGGLLLIFSRTRSELELLADKEDLLFIGWNTVSEA